MDNIPTDSLQIKRETGKTKINQQNSLKLVNLNSHKTRKKKEAIKQESGRRVKRNLEILEKNNPEHFLNKKLRLVALKYLIKFNIPNAESISEEIIMITYQKLLSGDRHWNENTFPMLEQQFIASLISETRNYCNKLLREKKLFISSADTVDTNTSEVNNLSKTPEQIHINEDKKTTINLFLNFLKDKDKEVFEIVSCFYYRGIHLSEEKVLAKELSVPSSTITNAKRRLTRLSLEFKSQYEGDLL